jgi:hypothetical protein
MATIALIIIGVISLLVKRNKLSREVFCWLAAGREHSIYFFPAKKPEMSTGRRWWEGLVWYNFFPAENIVGIFLVELVFSRRISVDLRWEVVAQRV